jgi:uncharacterized protein with PhoU and TrkA domain
VCQPCSFIGKDAKAELSNLPGISIIAVERATGETMHVTAHAEVTVMLDDVLWFKGTAESVMELRKIPGFELERDQVSKLGVAKIDRRLVQAVLSMRSKMVGKTVRSAHFRSLNPKP